MAERGFIKICTRRYRQGDETLFTPRADFVADDKLQPFGQVHAYPAEIWTLVRGEDGVGPVRGVGGVCLWNPPHGWHLWCRVADLDRREWWGAASLTCQHLLRFKAFHPGALLTASPRDARAGKFLEYLDFVSPDDADADDWRIMLKAA